MPPQPPGQRYSRQREAIARVIREAGGPLTVPEIHERAGQELSGLGIATVYRAVKTLLEDRQLRKVVLPSGETRYEPAGLGHHHHFHCRVCDRVYDLEICPVRIPRDREIGGGFVVESHELTLFGVCRQCA